jgi:hypothetical protein
MQIKRKASDSESVSKKRSDYVVRMQLPNGADYEGEVF